MNRSRVIALTALLLFTAGVTIGQNAEEAPATAQLADIPGSCARSMLLNFLVGGRDGQAAHQVPIWELPDKRAFFFVSGMTIDADGSPNAYNSENTGLDDLTNAGSPSHWDGIITDVDGNPLVQGAEDPFPGYYVSCTSLSDRTKRRNDPGGYVDASKIPYIVLPRDVAARGGARLGDFAVVVNARNGKSSYAIFADIGTLGEGSIALANNLGIWSDARQGGRRAGIIYLVFPGSGNRQPRTIDQINSETHNLVRFFGGIDKLVACASNEGQSAVVSANRVIDAATPSTP